MLVVDSGLSAPRPMSQAGAVRPDAATHQPAIPVRINRTIQLRRLNGVQADRLRHLVANTRLSETQKFVQCKNKAVWERAEDRVGHWFREQASAVDELERCQRGAYDKLGALERQRRCILKQQAARRWFMNREGVVRTRRRAAVMSGDEQLDTTDQGGAGLPSDRQPDPPGLLAPVPRTGPDAKEAGKTGGRPALLPARSRKYPIYRRNRDGQIVRSVVSYRKKEFRLPQEDENQLSPREKIKLRMDEAQVLQDERMHCFHEDLDLLESWNPLDDVRRSKPHEDTADVVLTDNTMVNVMDIFNRHFHLAVGTDPNSAEALKKCRYIRRKESTSKMMHSKENTFGYSE